MHRLLVRQLKKLQLNDLNELPTVEQWQSLLGVVSRTYANSDEDLARLERALEVSSLEMLERTNEMKHRSFHDHLTGLPNRALFVDRIELALAKSKRNRQGTAVLVLDLDNFKLVNDSLGHESGDELLRNIAVRLCLHARPGDTIARLGGDEFAILLEDLPSVDDARKVAARILEDLQTPVFLTKREAFASTSIGIAFTADPGLPSATLLKNADAAMYYAKSSGKSCFVLYDERMNDHATERLELETQLRRALENNELSVMYQPLVSIKTGKIIGCEALARWDHPTRGRISPTRFIQIAEEIGVIIPIGYWVLETACRQMKEWHTALGSETLTMSVNLSGKQVQRKDVVARVQEILTRTELKPDCLKLEITETVLMSDHDAVPKLMSLKELGVKLALDDFGTGYSSLATLSTFPVDTLKIDRAFIRRVEEEAEARAIVEAIMALSRSLKMDVTSEGVENFFQLAYVGQLGCATGQGFLFSKPLVADEFWNRLMAGGRYGAANSAIQDLDSSVTDSTDGEQAA